MLPDSRVAFSSSRNPRFVRRHTRFGKSTGGSGGRQRLEKRRLHGKEKNSLCSLESAGGETKRQFVLVKATSAAQKGNPRRLYGDYFNSAPTYILAFWFIIVRGWSAERRALLRCSLSALRRLSVCLLFGTHAWRADMLSHMRPPIPGDKHGV